jgi:hypothetical protein
MRVRLRCIVVSVLLAALSAGGASAADPNVTPELAAAIDAQRDGLVRFHYAARSGVYGDDDNLTIRGGDDEEPWECCDPCSVQVTVRRRGGEIRSIRWRVGRVRRTVPPGARDLGAVPADQAAAFFMQHALEPDADAQNEALQAAVIADVDGQWQPLAQLARDRQRSQELRRTAIFWLGMEAQDVVGKTLGELADNEVEDLEIRKHAVFAIAQRPDAESIPALTRMAKTHPNSELRKTALFWLAQKDAPEVIELFETIILDGS